MEFGEVSFYRSMYDVILTAHGITAVIYVWLFFSGDVVLENLILKQNALEELNIPVQTVYGHLGLLFFSYMLSIPHKLFFYYLLSWFTIIEISKT